ncbi:MAG: V-type ATP synthase subunit K [Symbiobacteriaceae bacterium]|nr:V-type ATP synthase subunit K [Symbiobacteriaceae bacterium]
MSLFLNALPEIMTIIGLFLALLLCGIGSAKGALMIGQAAAALISEHPDRFGQSLVLQMMSASQGLYGFIVAFLIFMKFDVGMGFMDALRCFSAGSLMGIAGWITADKQSILATAGIQILAKQPEHSTKGVLYSAMIETYAIFAFVISVLIVL